MRWLISKSKHSFFTKPIDFRSKVDINGERLNGDVSFKDGKAEIQIREDRNDPKKLAKALSEGIQEFKVTHRAKWSDKKLGRALVKIAHLMEMPSDAYKYILGGMWAR